MNQMRVAVIGAAGNMGRRYCAILRYLGHVPVEIDLGNEADIPHVIANVQKVIVATPTKTHASILTHVALWASKNTDVLCEKPVVTTEQDLFTLEKIVGLANFNLYCVNNYRYSLQVLNSGHRDGPTKYNYYHSGPDGLKWDCFQLIGLANGEIELRNTSPLWQCEINGVFIARSGIDQTYIAMISDFLSSKEHLWDFDKIKEVTRKVIAFHV